MAGHCPKGTNMKTKQHKNTQERRAIAYRWIENTATLQKGFADALDSLVGKPGAVMTFERTLAGLRIRRHGQTIDVDTDTLAHAAGAIGAADQLGMAAEIRDRVFAAIFEHAIIRVGDPTRSRAVVTPPLDALDAALARADELAARTATIDAVLDDLFGDLT
jgi:hypothetical protein